MQEHFQNLFMKTLGEFLDALETLDLTLCPKIQKAIKVYKASLDRINKEKLIKQFMVATEPFEEHITNSDEAMFEDAEKTVFFKHIEFTDLYRSVPDCRSSIFKYLQMFRGTGALASGNTIENMMQKMQSQLVKTQEVTGEATVDDGKANEANEANESTDTTNATESAIPNIDLSEMKADDIGKATDVLKNICGNDSGLNNIFETISEELTKEPGDQPDIEMSAEEKAQIAQMTGMMKSKFHMNDDTVNRMMSMAKNVAHKLGSSDNDGLGNVDTAKLMSSLTGGLNNIGGGAGGLESMLSGALGAGGNGGPGLESMLGGLMGNMGNMGQLAGSDDSPNTGEGIANIAKMLAKNTPPKTN